MKKYQVEYTKRAKKQIEKLDRSISERVYDAITRLEREPRPAGSKSLTGRDGWRIRVSDYRVVYDIFDKLLVIQVIQVGHRREIYRLIRR
jgi:mRNA interferase RelE/StbE